MPASMLASPLLVIQTLDGIPPVIIYIISGVFGAIIGSFLNVVIHRVPNEESIVFPNSRCPSCGATIACGRYREVRREMLTELGKLERRAERRGRQEGRVEGQQELVLQVLRRRFAPVPEAVEARVRQISDAEELGRLVEEAATMRALPEDGPSPLA